MPIIHYASNNDSLKPDIRTGLLASTFLFRFIDRDTLEVKQITATTMKQAKAFLGGDLIFAARFRHDDNFRVTRSRDMSHEIELSVAAKKSAQLNAVLFQLNSQFVGDPVVDSLIELAYELSNPVAGWLIEENAQRDNGHE